MATLGVQHPTDGGACGIPNCSQMLGLHESNLLWALGQAVPSGTLRQSNCKNPDKLGMSSWPQLSSRRHFGQTDWTDTAHRSIFHTSRILVSDLLCIAGRSGRMCNRRAQRLVDAGLCAKAPLEPAVTLRTVYTCLNDICYRLRERVIGLATGTTRAASVRTWAPRLPPWSRQISNLPNRPQSGAGTDSNMLLNGSKATRLGQAWVHIRGAGMAGNISGFGVIASVHRLLVEVLCPRKVLQAS